MSKKNNRTFISLATKNALVYFLLTLLGLFVLGYLLFSNSAKEIIKLSEQQVAHANENVGIKFSSFINDVERDITHLAHSPFLKEYLSNRDNKSKQLLSEEYLALIESKPDYSQIRFIGIEDDGREIIRAERANEIVFLVKDDSLQQKGNRQYFFETIALPSDSIYFSVIDLNKEFGKISNPPTPTIRAASPIHLDGNILGIIIINVDLRNLFTELKSMAGRNYDLKILNNDGFFLIHPDSSKTFLFEYGKQPGYQNEFNLTLDETIAKSLLVENSVLKDNDYLYSFRILNYPKNNYSIYSAIGSNERELLTSFYELRRESLGITFGLAILILFIAFIYMQRQANELKNITQTMTAFPKGMIPKKIPINRNDEIGQLAKSFEEMSKTISTNLDEIKNAKEEVEKAVKDKDAFLENMSHEIRNPIHSIIGMTHLLEKNAPGRHQHAFIESLKFNSKNLLSLVNDILDYKKLSVGEIKVDPEWFSLSALIHEITNSQRFSAVSKKIKLKIDIPEELNQYFVFFDVVRLTQIINNLVINAIKFTNENGDVAVRIEVLDKKENYLKIRFLITDNGVGITEENLAKIFERYFTKPESNNFNTPAGIGLGLPIVVQLLELFSSKLNIDSEEGKGSCFYFDLETPIKKQEAILVKENKNPLSEVLGDARILVVDDDEQVLFLYQHLFEEQVQYFCKILNLKDIKSLKDNKFDIIITDFYFNREKIDSQVQALNSILADEGCLYIVSGTSDQSSFQSLPIQVKKSFQKPINPDELVSAVACNFAAAHFGIPDVNSIKNDYDNDELKFQKAINLLIEEWEKMMKEIEVAMVNNDHDKYVAVHHKLITSVRRLKLVQFEKTLNLPLHEKKHLSSPSGISSEIKKMMGFFIWYLTNRIKE